MLFWALLEKRGVVFFATFWHKIVQKSPFSSLTCFLTFFGSFLTHFRSKSPKLPQIWYMGYFKNILQISYVQERHTSGSVVPGLMWQNWTKRDSLFWARGCRGHPYCSFVYPLAEGPKIPQNSPKHPILTPFWTPILGFLGGIGAKLTLFWGLFGPPHTHLNHQMITKSPFLMGQLVQRCTWPDITPPKRGTEVVKNRISGIDPLM